MNRFLLLIPLLFFTQLKGQVYEIPDITRVLVDHETNMVQIYFTGTDHPDVSHYKISQWRITGNNPVSSGIPLESSRTPHTGQASYFLELAIPEVTTEPVGFSVGAFDASDQVLLESFPPDSTIHLVAVYDSCLASVWLQWNDYNAWRGQLLQYEIRGSNTDGTYSTLVTLPEGTTETTINNLQANNSYHFYVLARLNNIDTGAYVTSNGVNFDTPHSYYPEYIHADYGTVAGSNHPFVRFTIDPLSELDTFQLLRSEEPMGQYEQIAMLNPVNNRIEYTDEEVDASLQPFYYRLAAINFCHEPIITSENTAGTIYLEAQLNNYSTALQWTDYFNWNTGVNHFDIERAFPGEDFQNIGNTTTLAFIDESLSDMLNQGENSEVCYRITAHENPGDPNSTTPGTSSSNVVCIHLPINVRFEYNAFVPGLDGFARFGPTIDFLPTEASFKIFNRWGNLIFETRDIFNLQWDGRIQGGDYAPEGVYRYQFKFKNEQGDWSVIHGSLTVVRH